MGSKFWLGLIDWIKESLLEEGNISPEDLDLMKIVDTPDEAVAEINDFYNKFCLSPNF
jgi:predicted Rossmann-fold nucleotide-binding protein